MHKNLTNMIIHKIYTDKKNFLNELYSQLKITNKNRIRMVLMIILSIYFNQLCFGNEPFGNGLSYECFLL